MKEITVICVAYRRYQNIPVLIHAFLAQTLQNFRLIVIHDGYDAEMDNLLKPYQAAHPDVFSYRFSETRFGDYGHSLRDMGIKMADTEYILLTNDDNYYCPKFLEYMFTPMRQWPAPPDIVMCDMIHSHNRPGGRPQAPYNFFETKPARFSVDMGCFIARTALAKQVGFRDKTHDGDATYFEDLLKAAGNAKIAKIPHVLFVHN
ncbi:MAG: glycosyltransferase family 2 protein [Rhodospirillaceae bacterium]|nr:glycosyltransferase family 2 protein [Rhodospirillaceae bacterium]